MYLNYYYDQAIFLCHLFERIKMKYMCCLVLITLFSQLTFAIEKDLTAEELSINELKMLGLQDLLDVTIETASGIEETLLDAPATMMVVTAEEIKQRGYQDLTEVFQDLPGFDVIIPNGTTYMNAYQRGYRTPYTTRTLFMINGIIDNLLWSHEAAISRQYPLSNIKRIEILYGPASAVYGPNAFLGVVNVITNDAQDLEVGDVEGEVNIQRGSHKSKGIDASVRGKLTQEMRFSLSTKVFQSDEPNYTDKYGFQRAELYNDPKIWGPLLNIEHEGTLLGHYYDPTDDYSILADVHYKNLKLGLIHWKTKEAYGPYYPADRVQNNAFWNKDSDQYFAEYDTTLTDKINSRTLLLYRDSRRYGYWAEAEPDWNEGMEEYAYVSFTQWNSNNHSWLFKQDFEYALRDDLLLSAGLKYERKELTNAYDIPGYWAPAVSSVVENGSGVVHSSEPVYNIPPSPPQAMLDSNLETTRDIGGYIQGIFDIDNYRFNLGIRYDQNSMYGNVVNPRASMIYKHSDSWTFKLIYGEAFQEPAPLQLWGGWNGRGANPDMQPEKTKNLEFVTIQQLDNLLHEVSIYGSRYEDVIKEEAENAGARNVYGFEYRAKLFLPNMISEDFDDISSYFNYSYTDSSSSVYYDHDLAEWLGGEVALGDIAPHKFNIGVNLPLRESWNINLRGNYVGERELYTRNPLRGQGEKLDSYFTLNGVITYIHDDTFDISLKALNILDENYFHPGVESANAGNDFTQRSKGYLNSLLPQPGRTYWLNLRISF